MPHPATEFDVAIVGGGPSGSSCASFCAKAGMRAIVIERALFPREKVCGDCLNPVAWPVIERLNVAEKVRALVHSQLAAVEFIGCDDRKFEVELPHSIRGEIAVKRSALDHLLLQRAQELGAELLAQTTVTAVKRTTCCWLLATSAGSIKARYLVAADGRNSSVSRLLGLQPAVQRDRVAVQTHLQLPADMRERVRMQFVPEGYTGLADVGGEEGNLCLVARPENIERLQKWAATRYGLRSKQIWRTVTPLSRAPVEPCAENLLLVGDAARVVEPFTGEGIAYALASGELAANALCSDNLSSYGRAHKRLYRGRLWLNYIAKAACLEPHLATHFLVFASRHSFLLQFLTRKVVGGGGSAESKVVQTSS